MSRKRRCASRATSAFDLPVSGNSQAIEPEVSTRSTRTRDSMYPLTSSVAVRNGSAAAKSIRARAPPTSSLGSECAVLTQSRFVCRCSITCPECWRTCLRCRNISRAAEATITTPTAIESAVAIPMSP